jgi:hypothetical protein
MMVVTANVVPSTLILSTLMSRYVRPKRRFHISEDAILHSHRRENLKSLIGVMHSKGFWRWCVTLITIKLLDFVHRPDFSKQKTQRFGNWICFRLQARGGGHLLYRKTKSLPFQKRCQKRRRSTTGNKGTVNTWPQEVSMGCNKRIRNEKFGGGEEREKQSRKWRK